MLDKLEQLYESTKQATTAKLEEAYSAAVDKISPANSLTAAPAAKKKKKPGKVVNPPAVLSAVADPAPEPADESGGMGTGAIVAIVLALAAGAWALTR